MKKNPLKIILNVLLTLFALIVGIFIILTAYQKISGKKVMPYSVLWVLTDSMEDTIPAKSYILVKTVDAKDIKEHDIIVFHSRDEMISGKLNTHRVMKIIGDHEGFVTKGDAYEANDPLTVMPEDVVAKYVRNMPVLTFFGRFFSTNMGFFLCMIFMLVGTFFWFYRYFAQKRDVSDEEEFDRLVKKEIKRLEKEYFGESGLIPPPKNDDRK